MRKKFISEDLCHIDLSKIPNPVRKILADQEFYNQANSNHDHVYDHYSDQPAHDHWDDHWADKG